MITASGQALTALSTTQVHDLGELLHKKVTHLGKSYCNVYRYCVAGAIVTAGKYVEFNGETPYEVEMGNTANYGNLLGGGMAMVTTTAAGEFLWVLVEGVDTINTYTGGALEVLQAAASGGALTGETQAEDAKNVGYVTADNVGILHPPGNMGLMPN